MRSRDPQFDAYVLEIHNVLDRLDYYHLLGIEPSAGVNAVREAFLAIAAKFHPDRNRDASGEVQKALYDIFKRLNEAYRVLGDPEKKALYDKGRAQGQVRLEHVTRSAGPKSPADALKSSQARQFYRQAVSDLKEGRLMQAELNLKLVLTHEREHSEVVEELRLALEAAKRQKTNG